MPQVVVSVKVEPSVRATLQAVAREQGLTINAVTARILTVWSAHPHLPALGEGIPLGGIPLAPEAGGIPAGSIGGGRLVPLAHAICRACGHLARQHHRPGQCAGTCACRKFQE